METRLQMGIAVSVLLIVSKFSDIVITFAISPDLTGERSILAAYAGGGWGLIFLATTLLLAVTIPFYWIYLYGHRDLWPRQRGLGFVPFLGHIVSGRTGSWRLLLGRSPGWRRKAILFGLTIPWAVVAASIAVGLIHWFAIHVPESRRLYHEIGVRYYPLAALFVVATVFLTLWVEYSLYRRGAGRPTQAD